MTPGPVLVTGATGRHRGTGAHVVRHLQEHGVPVHALVRRRDERAARIEALGAEVVVGDLHDRRTLLPALEGVSSVYFTYPVDAGVVPAAANYTAAVREVDTNPRTVVLPTGARRIRSIPVPWDALSGSPRRSCAGAGGT